MFTFSVYKTLLYVVERLADDGHDVVGLECAEKGCREFFEEQDMPYTTENLTECEGKVFKVRLIDQYPYEIVCFTQSTKYIKTESPW